MLNPDSSYAWSSSDKQQMRAKRSCSTVAVLKDFAVLYFQQRQRKSHSFVCHPSPENKQRTIEQSKLDLDIAAQVCKSVNIWVPSTWKLQKIACTQEDILASNHAFLGK